MACHFCPLLILLLHVFPPPTHQRLRTPQCTFLYSWEDLEPIQINSHHRARPESWISGTPPFLPSPPPHSLSFPLGMLVLVASGFSLNSPRYPCSVLIRPLHSLLDVLDWLPTWKYPLQPRGASNPEDVAQQGQTVTVSKLQSRCFSTCHAQVQARSLGWGVAGQVVGSALLLASQQD